MDCVICGNKIEEPVHLALFGGYDESGEPSYVHERCHEGAVSYLRAWVRGDFHKQRQQYSDALELVQWLRDSLD